MGIEIFANVEKVSVKLTVKEADMLLSILSLISWVI